MDKSSKDSTYHSNQFSLFSLGKKTVHFSSAEKSQELKGCSNLVITYKVAFMQKVVQIPGTDQEMIPHSYAKKLIFTGFGQIDRVFPRAFYLF